MTKIEEKLTPLERKRLALITVPNAGIIKKCDSKLMNAQAIIKITGWGNRQEDWTRRALFAAVASGQLRKGIMISQKPGGLKRFPYVLEGVWKQYGGQYENRKNRADRVVKDELKIQLPLSTPEPEPEVNGQLGIELAFKRIEAKIDELIECQRAWLGG